MISSYPVLLTFRCEDDAAEPVWSGQSWNAYAISQLMQIRDTIMVIFTVGFDTYTQTFRSHIKMKIQIFDNF